MRGWVYLKTRAEIGFLEFFQKPPSGHAQPARRNKWQNQFPGFLIWTAWRQRMIRQATRTRLHYFWPFWYFWGTC